MHTHWKTFDPKIKYLGSHDLIDPKSGLYTTITGTVSGLTKEKVVNDKGQAEERVIMTFKELKPLIMNKTNLRMMERLHGPYIENWTGKKITLRVQSGVQAFGEIRDAVRIDTPDPLPELVALYETKESVLSEDAKSRIKAIIDKKESASYSKTIKYLQSL